MSLSLDAVFARLGVDPLAEGVQVVPAALIAPPQPFSPLLPFATTRPLLVCGLDCVGTLQRVHAGLRAAYPEEYPVHVVGNGTMSRITLAQLGMVPPSPDLCVYLPAQPVLQAVRSVDALQEITARLRAPGGCPWDRQQTHESLKPFLLEETYEVLEALDSGDRQELREELGDLLMQVMIHAQVAAEAGEFDLGDVVAAISSKLMRRHPHVFGDVRVSGAQEVLRNWQSIKQAEKTTNGDEPPPSLLGGVPLSLPALAYAQAIQERAARLGFMRLSPTILSDIGESITAVSKAASQEERMTAFGDLLFRLALWGGWLDKEGLGVNAEEALRLANRRYRERFERVEALCRKRGLDIQTLSEEQRRQVWEEAAR